MANEKVIQTRLSLKIDTYANWTNVSVAGKGGNLVLNKGEVGFCEIPAGNGAATTAPTVLFKVGTYDGVNDSTKVAFKDLKWASALAADVYDWAKKPQAEFEAWVKTLVPVTVVDNGTGKFVTDVSHSTTDNGRTITITRDDAVNTLAGGNGTDNIITTVVDKSKGDVKVTANHAKKGPATAYTGGQTGGTADAFGESVTIKVPKLTVDTYGHVNSASDVEYKVAIPQNVDTWRAVAVNGTTHLQKTDDTALQIDHGSNIEVEWDEEDGAVVISHGAKPATGTAHAATAGTGRTYVTKVDVDSYGHIAKVYTATETVVDHNTAHNHENGVGTTVTADGGIDGSVAVNLNLKFGTLTADNKLQLLDATSDSVVAEFDATEFVKDSFLKGAEYDSNENILTLQFLDNDNNTTDIDVDLSTLVDVYNADEKTLTKNGSTFSIKAGGVGETELAQVVIQEIAKGVTAYGWGNHTNAGYAIADDLATVATSGSYNDLTNKPDSSHFLQNSGGADYALISDYDSGVNFESTLYYNEKEVAVKDDIPTKPEDIGAAPAPTGTNEDGEKNIYLEFENNGEEATATMESTGFDIINFDGVILQAGGKNVATIDQIPTKPSDIGAASAPGNNNVYLELVNNGNDGAVTMDSSGFETVNFEVELQVDGNEVLTTASTISTDKLVGGSEIWIIDCGTSTTVI